MTIEQLIEELQDLMRRGVSPMSPVEIKSHRYVEGIDKPLLVDEPLDSVAPGGYGVVYLKDRVR